MGKKFKPVNTKPIQSFFKRTREDDNTQQQQQRQPKQLKLDNETSPIDSPAYDDPASQPTTSSSLTIDDPADDDDDTTPPTSTKPERAYPDTIHSDEYGICPTELCDEFESYWKAVHVKEQSDVAKQCDVNNCTFKRIDKNRYCKLHYSIAKSFQQRSYGLRCSIEICYNKGVRALADGLCKQCHTLGETRTRQEHLVHLKATHDEIKAQARSDFDLKV